LNFKNIILAYFIVFLFGCGVKSDPVKPPDIAIKSYIDSYTGNQESKDAKKAPDTKNK
jgi:hypothetical protein